MLEEHCIDVIQELAFFVNVFGIGEMGKRHVLAFWEFRFGVRSGLE